MVRYRTTALTLALAPLNSSAVCHLSLVPSNHYWYWWKEQGLHLARPAFEQMHSATGNHQPQS